jgi:hypothetical protein
MHQGGDEVDGGAPVCIRVDGQVGEGGLDGDVGLGVAVLRGLQRFEGFKVGKSDFDGEGKVGRSIPECDVISSDVMRNVCGNPCNHTRPRLPEEAKDAVRSTVAARVTFLRWFSLSLHVSSLADIRYNPDSSSSYSTGPAC